MEITLVKMDIIKENKNNVKEHPEYQIDAIKKSITEFGFNDPIALDKDNVIIEGHGRFAAAKSLGYTEIPAIYLDKMTPEQIRAYTIVHNKLTLMTDFNIEKLEKELSLIENIDMDDFGFEDFEDMFDDFKALSTPNISGKSKGKSTHTCPKCGCQF